MLERLARPFAGFAGALGRFMDAFYRALGRPGRLLQDFLNGVWLGHALHPILTDVVIGGATVAVLLMVLTWFGVEGLYVAIAWTLGLTVLAALGAAVSGLTDFKDTAGDEQNIAAVHGIVNVLAVIGLVIALVAAIGESAALLGVSLLVAYGLLTISGFLGGHVVFKYGSMVNHNDFPAARRAKEFTAILPVADLPEATPTRAMLGTTALVVVRRGDVVHALKETCAHAGGPLSKGELKGDVIVCPWHASHFSLLDGRVVHGPATHRQPAYAARINGDQVEVQGPIE
ncbi:MAG TPA: Rieske 2Fe-2S domain-containing protein [Candidatus Limnocylindria bacterium]